MSSIEYLCKSAGLCPSKLSKEENLLLDTYLLCFIIQEFNRSKPCHILQEENEMTHGNIIHFILRDLINTNDYTMSGIAAYSDVPEDVIYDIAIGANCNPTLEVTRKIVELHRTARSSLYKHVMDKIINDYTISSNEFNSRRHSSPSSSSVQAVTTNKKCV